MPPLSDIEAQYRSKAFRFLGSFWNNIFADKDQARKLVDLAFRTSIGRDIEALYADLAGVQEDARLVAYVDVPYRPNDIFEAGMLVYDDPDYAVRYGEMTDTDYVFDTHRVKYWVLPMTNIWPLRIQAQHRTLIIGVDFFVNSGKWLYFRRDPRLLFQSNYYTVARGLDLTKQSSLDFFTRLVVPKNRDFIIKWLRSVQTPGSFYLALAAAAGLAIVRRGGELQSIVELISGEVVYTFPDETLIVDYPHDRLALRRTYTPETVVGNVIRMYVPTEDNRRWWRQVDWMGGILLDPILPQFRGLPLLDKDSFAYVAGQDPDSLNGSQVHARVALTDDFYREDAYWQYVAARETASGYYLNGLLRLPEEVDGGNPTIPDTFAKALSLVQEANEVNAAMGLPKEQPALRALPGSRTVNPLDVFFESSLGKQAMVITIDMSKLAQRQNLAQFLVTHMPVGATLITMGFFPDGVVEEVILGENLVVDELIEVVPSQDVTLTDEFDLSLTHDYVELTPIFPEP